MFWTYYTVTNLRKEIAAFLLSNLNVSVSDRALQSRFTQWGWKKHESVSTELLQQVIEEICQENRHNFGYRTVWFIMKTRYELRVPRADVEVAMRNLFQASRELEATGFLVTSNSIDMLLLRLVYDTVIRKSFAEFGGTSIPFAVIITMSTLQMEFRIATFFHPNRIRGPMMAHPDRHLGVLSTWTTWTSAMVSSPSVQQLEFLFLLLKAKQRLLEQI